MLSSELLTESVLVVDDDLNFHRLAAAALEPAGIGVVCVRSGEEAQKLLGGSVPRAVIVDGLLPGVRGDELARRLRQRYSKELLPIIFVSAFYRDMKSYRLLTRECGVDLVLHKPVTVEQLQASLAPFLVTASEALEGEEIVLDLAGTSPADAEPVDDSLALVELTSEYLVQSKERALEMKVALGTLSGPGGGDALRMIGLEGHRFRGSGGSFGFPELSRLGGAIEDLVTGNPALLESGSLRALLAGLVEALTEKVLSLAGSAPLPTSLRAGELARVLVLDPGAAGGDAPFRDVRSIRVETDLDTAVERAIDMRPDVVFVAMEGEELLRACERLLAAVPAQVVVLGGDGSLESRLAAVRAGAAGMVPRPLDGESLMRLAAIYQKPRIAARAVVVGTDPQKLSWLAELLAPRGIAVAPCPTRAELLPTLERASPSMIVVYDNLTSMTGLELLQLLRADVRYRDLPIILLGKNPDERVAAISHGASDWLPIDVEEEELEARLVAPLLKRERSVRVGFDPVTGLPERRRLLDGLEGALLLARREGRNVALLGIDTNLGAWAEETGRFAAEEAMMAFGTRLVRSFRTTDLVARVGRWRFVALLHGAGRADAQRLLDAELAEFRKAGHAEPKGALVVFPEATGAGVDLLEELEEALG